MTKKPNRQQKRPRKKKTAAPQVVSLTSKRRIERLVADDDHVARVINKIDIG